MSKPLVILSHPLPEAWIESLSPHCELLIGPADDQGLAPNLIEKLPQASGLLTLLIDPVDQDLLQQAPQLKVVSNMAVGVDNIDLAACTKHGIPVGHTPGVLTEGTADLTLALLLALARKIPAAAQDAKDGRWQTWTPTGWLGADLYNKRLGIIGMGKIGQAVAQRAYGFGLEIVYSNRSPKPEIETRLGAKQIALDELITTSDFVSLHVPLTPATKGLIDLATLRAMKPTAYLINLARGPVVNTQALVAALQDKSIAGAALDVTDPEPLPANHPLYQFPNCLITPHIGSATQHTRRRMAELACNNLLAGLNDKQLPHCVNPEVYVKKIEF